MREKTLHSVPGATSSLTVTGVQWTIPGTERERCRCVWVVVVFWSIHSELCIFKSAEYLQSAFEVFIMKPPTCSTKCILHVGGRLWVCEHNGYKKMSCLDKTHTPVWAVAGKMCTTNQCLVWANTFLELRGWSFIWNLREQFYFLEKVTVFNLKHS